METNRRNWLKQIGLSAAAIGLTKFDSFASPADDHFEHAADALPVRLSSNENPYGPSASAKKAMADALGKSNRYNWETNIALISLLAQQNKVTEDNILIAAGSTEILDLTVHMASEKKGNFIMADPSYMNWTALAQRLGLKKIAVPVTADKKIDLPAMQKAITADTALIYICNPNNPTGTICEREALTQFIEEATQKTIVLVDEAYIHFTEQPSLSNLVADRKNLVIARTFSKIYGLAGARVGYAIGHAETIERLSRFQTWSNGSIGVVSAAAALASLKDEAFVKETYALNAAARKYTTEQLEQRHIPCISSHTNFLYFSLEQYKQDFFEKLKKNNIQGTKIYEEQGRWSRITMGTMQEMKKFISAIS